MSNARVAATNLLYMIQITINTYMKINEITFSKLAEPTKEQASAYFNGAEFIQHVAGYELFRNTLTDNLEIFLYVDDAEVVGYTKIQKRKHSNNRDYWWLMELWIKNDPEYRRKGLGTALVRFARDNKTRLIVDKNISYNAFKLLKKMIDGEILQARILDLYTGDAVDFEYATLINNENATFILENYEVRSKYLQPITMLNYVGLQ